jgi:hypothetical protein
MIGSQRPLQSPFLRRLVFEPRKVQEVRTKPTSGPRNESLSVNLWLIRAGGASGPAASYRGTYAPPVRAAMWSGWVQRGAVSLDGFYPWADFLLRPPDDNSNSAFHPTESGAGWLQPCPRPAIPV